MSEELKPCPFCGKELAVNRRKHNPYARCATENCNGGRLPLLNLDQPEDVAAWNTRATLSPAHIEDEREACERWIRQQIGMPSHIPMDWEAPLARYAWLAWKARAALCPAHIEDGEEVEVVAHLIIPAKGSYKWRHFAASGPVPAKSSPLKHYEPLMTVAQHQRIVGARASKVAARIEDEREAYEQACHARAKANGRVYEAHYFKRSGHGWYLNPSAEAGWQAWQARAALSAPPAAGVPIGMACKINGYWEAQLFAGHGCIDRQSLYAHPLPPADVPTGLAHRLLKAYDHGDTGAIEAAIEDIRTMLAAAPTPPASEQQRAVVMPERAVGGYLTSQAESWNACLDEFLRLNPHLAKGEGV